MKNVPFPRAQFLRVAEVGFDERRSESDRDSDHLMIALLVLADLSGKENRIAVILVEFKGSCDCGCR